MLDTRWTKLLSESQAYGMEPVLSEAELPQEESRCSSARCHSGKDRPLQQRTQEGSAPHVCYSRVPMLSFGILALFLGNSVLTSSTLGGQA